jgi:hypothetical protein
LNPTSGEKEEEEDNEDQILITPLHSPQQQTNPSQITEVLGKACPQSEPIAGFRASRSAQCFALLGSAADV